ncbi:putative glutamine--tRNA ligase [Rosa chinensis]|uniref:Putative glutamine--tRNA ligase n=1 Tax=Rosa chinensis TaxID=74649 RepID=A0A2P6PPZ7_ROSCH|nr:putative glutamine--tRNA ligase [Rosa chinensis]
MIHLSRLEYHIREELNKTAPRTMVVLDLVKVVITNWKDDLIKDCEARKWPDSEAESYKVPFSKVLYIERSNFRLKTQNTTSDLLLENLPCSDTHVLSSVWMQRMFVLAEDNETVLEIQVEYDQEKKTKPKVYNPSVVLELKMCFKIRHCCFLLIF